MDVYFSMLYAVLGDKYPLIDLSVNEEPLRLAFPKMYNGKLENGCIYVVGDVSTFVVPEQSGDYVLLFHETDALGIKFPLGTRAILIGGCHNSVEAYESLSELFIQFERWNAEFLRLSLLNSTVIYQMLEYFYSIINRRMVYDDENFRHIYEFPMYKELATPLNIKYSTDVSASPSAPEYASYPQFVVTMNSTAIATVPDCPKVQITYAESINNTVIVRKLYKGDQIIGRLTVKYDQEMPRNVIKMDGLCRIVDMFCNYLETAMIIALRGSVSESTDAMHTAFHQLILKSNTSAPRDIVAYLSEQRWSQYDEYMLVTIDIEKRSVFADVSGYLRGHFENIWNNCIGIRENNRIVLLFNMSISPDVSTDEIMEHLKMIHNDNVDAISRVAVSAYFNNILLADDYYAQCEYLLGHKKLWAHNIWVLYYKDHSMDYISDYLISQYRTEFLCHSGVLMLERYDKENETELLKTLYYYIKCHLNTTEASKVISVHRTTFIKRLQKICNIYNFNFDSTSELLHMLLSFKILNFEE